MIQEIEQLQKIVNDENRPAEERKEAAEHILALQTAPTVPVRNTLDEKIKIALDNVLDPAKAQQRLERYLASHKKCAVCLRHHDKQATKCELCGTEGGEWLPVTTQRPLDGPHSREYLSNLHLNYDPSTTNTKLRWMLDWREGDGYRWINAATRVVTPYVLSEELRDWCKQLLDWIEPDVVAPPEPQQPTTTQTAEPQPLPETPAKAGLSSETFWEYTEWKVSREAEGLPAGVADFMAENETASFTARKDVGR